MVLFLLLRLLHWSALPEGGGCMDKTAKTKGKKERGEVGAHTAQLAISKSSQQAVNTTLDDER